MRLISIDLRKTILSVFDPSGFSHRQGQTRSCGCFRSTSAQATQAEFQGAPPMSRSCRHRTSVANPLVPSRPQHFGFEQGPGARCDTAVSEVLHGNKRLGMAMVPRLRARFRVWADLLLPPPRKRRGVAPRSKPRPDRGFRRERLSTSGSGRITGSRRTSQPRSEKCHKPD